MPGQSRLASIEPNADRWWDSANVPHATRWALDLPTLGNCRAYLLDTLESTLELLAKAPEDDEALYFYRLCLFHEDMHGEAFVITAQTLGMKLDKAFVAAFTPPPVVAREPMLVPATVWQLGSPAGAGFIFDNEKAPHAVSVPEFEIDAQPVSWAQFVEFVDDGGYDRAELWHPDGWRWLQALAAGEGRRGPRYVEEIGVAMAPSCRPVSAARCDAGQSTGHAHDLVGGRRLVPLGRPPASPQRSSGKSPRTPPRGAVFAGVTSGSGWARPFAPSRGFHPTPTWNIQSPGSAATRYCAVARSRPVRA